MINHDGKAVKPDAAAFQAAAAHADWAHSDDYYVILTDQPGPDTWPIAGATFILMPKQPPNVDNAAAALKFFDWAYTQGGKMAEDLDYVPLPNNVVASIRAMWAAEIKASGRQAGLHRRRSNLLSAYRGVRGRPELYARARLPQRLNSEPESQ